MTSQGKNPIGKPLDKIQGTWVQTDRSAHLAWAKLISEHPKAGTLLHVLVSLMSKQNAVVISQKMLGKLVGCTPRTIQKSLTVLEDGLWVERVRLNGPGTVCAYVVNSRVAWSDKRENIQYSAFNAVVVADMDDQTKNILEDYKLRSIPSLYPGEYQAPDNSEGEPPVQEVIDGMLPDLPSLLNDD